MINLEYLLFLILRLAVFIPGLILVILTASNLIKKWGFHNGMKPYRLLLALLTLSFTADAGLIALSNYYLVFFNISHSTFLGGLTWVRIALRALEITTIVLLYKLIFDAKHDGKDHK